MPAMPAQPTRSPHETQTSPQATAVSLLALAGWMPSVHAAEDTIKVGILHSLSGTMAISETSLKDVALMAIDEINAKGGVMGRKLEPVVVDPASNWPLFAEKSRQLLAQDKVAVVFGCWTSVSRKSVLPVFRAERPAVLSGAVRGRGTGEERVLHRRRAQPAAIPAVEYLMSEDGGGAALRAAGHDVYPRTTNKILRAFLHSGREGQRHRRGLHALRPFRLPDHRRQHQEVRHRQDHRHLHHQRRLQRALLQDFESIKTPVNTDFIAKWKAYAKAKNLPNAATVVTNDPMEATYIGIHMWKQAVEQAKSTDVDKVIAAMGGQTFSSPSGFEIMMDKTNHHLHKPVYIGEIKADGQFNVVWKSKGPIRAQPWSPYIPATKASRASEGDGRHAQRCDRTLPASSPARPVPGLAGAARGGGRRRPTCWRRWRATIPTRLRAIAALGALPGEGAAVLRRAPTSSTRRRTAAC